MLFKLKKDLLYLKAGELFQPTSFEREDKFVRVNYELKHCLEKNNEMQFFCLATLQANPDYFEEIKENEKCQCRIRCCLCKRAY